MTIEWLAFFAILSVLAFGAGMAVMYGAIEYRERKKFAKLRRAVNDGYKF